jgi:ATP-dependent protease ClpP protease subunit
MKDNKLFIPQQTIQTPFNEMKSQGKEKQAQYKNEPANPFLYSGTPSDNEDTGQAIENVKQVGSVTQVEPVKDICFISIIGEIEGHTALPPQSKTTKYEHIIPMIIGAEMDPQVKGLLLLLNTMGGDVEAGLAISELVASITKPTVSIVLGGGHSIGTALAVSADYSFIAPTGTMTIHPIRTNGLVIGVPQTFRYFQKMQERITDFIVMNSRVDKDALLEYMYKTDEIANDVGTVLNAEEVVSIGLIDEIGGFSQAMVKLRELIDKIGK